MVLAVAVICLVIVFAPLYPVQFLSWGIDSMSAFFIVIFAGVVVYILVRERLIFGAEEREEDKL